MNNQAKIITLSKACTKCKAIKPLSEFYDDKRVKRDGKISRCKSCYVEHSSNYQKNLPEHRKQARREKYSTGDYAKSANYKKLYGITLDDVKRMHQSQMGLCDNRGCGKRIDIDNLKPHANKAVVDHCHTTGRVRGLLCFKCNTTLGLMEDKNVVLGLAEYLHKYGQTFAFRGN